jgi:hypothetical protein
LSKKPPPAEAKLTKVQKFTVSRVHRSQLKNAAYNPRSIDDYTRDALKAELKALGLVEPLVWNKRTGNLVGGHQRISCVDAIEGHANYLLDVSVIDVDLAHEKKLNIALNNAMLQGNYDLEKMLALVKDLKETDSKFDTNVIGFGGLELKELAVNTSFQDYFVPPDPIVDEVANELADVTPERDPKTGRTPQETAKHNRGVMKDKHKQEDDAESYLVITCASREECAAISAVIGGTGKPDEKYIDGLRVFRKLGIEVPKTEMVR